MPIDDVQYLLRNSVKDSTLVFVDSAQRDAEHYPTPSEYVVALDEPIRNVYGVDVLDATIPNTMFNVDVHNNGLKLLTVDTAGSDALQAARAALPMQPSTDQLDASDVGVLSDLFFELGFATPMHAWMASLPAGAAYRIAVLDGDAARALAWYGGTAPAPPAPDAGIDFAAAGSPQYIAVVRQRIGAVQMRVTSGGGSGSGGGGIGIGGSSDGGGVGGVGGVGGSSMSNDAAVGAGGAVAFNGARYAVLDGNAAALAALAVPGRFAIVRSVVPPSASASASFSSTASATAAAAASGVFDVLSYSTAVLTAAQYAGLATAQTPTLFRLDAYALGLELGNYTRDAALQAAVQTALTDAQLSITAAATTSTGIEKQGILRLVSDADTRVLIDVENSTATALLGYNMRASLSANATPASLRGRNSAAVELGGRRMPMLVSVLSQQQQQLQQLLDAPGLVNLLGVRYVTLRCREIEEHMGSAGGFGSYAPGIGVFKLLSSNEVVQVRLDFTNLVRRPFHPVAKLARMTLRFELPDGSLYDFKGVDNQMLLTIRYYQPAPNGDGLGVRAFPSVLNPDYDPDFSKFVANRTAFAACLDDPGAPDDDACEEDDDASDEDEDDDEDDEDDEDDDDDDKDGTDPFGHPQRRGLQDQVALQRRIALAERDAWAGTTGRRSASAAQTTEQAAQAHGVFRR
jgi:hypothetical protein